MGWLAKDSGTAFGPLTPSELRSLVKSGILSKAAFVREEADQIWLPLSDVPWLTAATIQQEYQPASPAPQKDKAAQKKLLAQVATAAVLLLGIVTAAIDLIRISKERAASSSPQADSTSASPAMPNLAWEIYPSERRVVNALIAQGLSVEPTPDYGEHSWIERRFRFRAYFTASDEIESAMTSAGESEYVTQRQALEWLTIFTASACDVRSDVAAEMMVSLASIAEHNAKSGKPAIGEKKVGGAAVVFRVDRGKQYFVRVSRPSS